MHRIFLPVYRFFQGHKALMWVLLVVSTLVFGWFGAKLRYEEDIMKLLPRSTGASEVAFSDIELIDKVFIQVTSRDTLNPVNPIILGNAIEEFCQILEEKDTATHYISGILSTLDVDTALGAMEFGLEHLPSFVDTSWYAFIENSTTREAIAAQMVENAHLVMEDETGDDTQMVTMDPLNLRSLLIDQYFSGEGMMGGYNMFDGHLFCMDKSVALAFLAPSFASTNSGKATRLVNMINKCKREFEASHPDIRVLVHGNPQGSVSNAGTIKRDLVWTIGLSLLIILAIMLFSFRSVGFILHQILPVVYGTLFSMACMY